MTFLRQIFALTIVLVTCLPGIVLALDPDNVVPLDSEIEPVHWAFGSFLGTGWYKLDQNREVFVLRVPPRWYFRDSSIDESGQRQLGIEFHFPLTFGLHKLDGFDDFLDFDNIGTVSFNPGVEIEYPVSERWLLRAFAHLGWGTQVDSSDRAWIYDAGAKSRYAFKHGQLDWGLVNGIFFAGYNSRDTGKDSLGGFTAGLDFAYPLSLGSGTGTPLQLKWDVGYRWYNNDLSFNRPLPPPDRVENEWEIGLALARQDGPIKIWFLKFEQMGLVYRFNSDGTYRAITVNFRSPLTR
jgi:hypothetical protein